MELLSKLSKYIQCGFYEEIAAYNSLLLKCKLFNLADSSHQPEMLEKIICFSPPGTFGGTMVKIEIFFNYYPARSMVLPKGSQEHWCSGCSDKSSNFPNSVVFQTTFNCSSFTEHINIYLQDLPRVLLLNVRSKGLFISLRLQY